MAQQDIANQNADLQMKIAGMQADQAATALAYQKSQDAQRQAEADKQADLQKQYDTARTQLQQNASDWVEKTFGQYDDNYFQKYASDYANALNPEIDRQYTQAQGNLLFGLARTGNLNSQAHADQQGLLDQTRGRAYSQVATSASQAAQDLKAQIGQQKQSLLQQILTTGAIGQPVSPGTIDEVNATIDQTNRAIGDVTLSAQDQLAKIGQLPSTSTLGNVFGGVASGLGSYLSGVNAYNTSVIGGAGGVGSGGAGGGPSAPGLR